MTGLSKQLQYNALSTFFYCTKVGDAALLLLSCRSHMPVATLKRS